MLLRSREDSSDGLARLLELEVGRAGGGGTSLYLPTEREVVTILHSRSLQEGLQGRTLLGRKLGV